jgi:membrane fusion protein, multidrug efflux system
MKKNAAIALAGVLIVAVAGGWWSMSGDKLGSKNAKTTAAAGNGAPAGGGAPALVTLATAEKQDVPVTVQVNGSVVSLNSVDLRPQVTNTVSTVHVKEGQFVKAGQLLFSLDDRNDQANLARARAQQQKDEATMADLERQYKRSQDLVAQNFIAKSAADATLSQLEAQRAAVAADRAAVQSAQVALGYATLRAPIAGRIGAVNIYPGTLVQPTLSLVTVTQLDPIAVSFPVPEGNLQDLLEAARSRSPVEALVTGRKTPLIGSLDFVDNTVDPQIGTVRAKAVFSNPDQGLWPGQFVGTRITVRTLSGATVVPAAALMMLSDGTSLYVVDQAKTATRRKVKTLHTFGTKVAVSGVEPGEQVVIEGSQNVRPGGKVRVDAKTGGAGGPGTAPNGTTGVTPGSAASSEGTEVKPPQRERA